MWACYMIDVWAGSGVDHLTILNEKDLKIQLPCNERQFLLQIPVVTERLQEGDIIDFIPEEDIPEKPKENLGMAAYYVRIVSIWRRVLRYAPITSLSLKLIGGQICEASGRRAATVDVCIWLCLFDQRHSVMATELAILA